MHGAYVDALFVRGFDVYGGAARAQLAVVNNQLVRENIVLRSDLARLELKLQTITAQRDDAATESSRARSELQHFAVRLPPDSKAIRWPARMRMLIEALGNCMAAVSTCRD